MQKLAARCLVGFFGFLLAFLFVQDVLTIVNEIHTICSSLEYEKLDNGFYDSTIVVVSASHASEMGQTVDLLNHCSCSKTFHRIPNKTETCNIDSFDYYDVNIPNKLAINTSGNSKPFRYSVIESPRDFTNGENIKLSCSSDFELLFTYIFLPITYESITHFENDGHIGEFFDGHFASRPKVIVSGGQSILIKLESTVFRDTAVYIGKGLEKMHFSFDIWSSSCFHRVFLESGTTS